MRARTGPSASLAGRTSITGTVSCGGGNSAALWPGTAPLAAHHGGARRGRQGRTRHSRPRWAGSACPGEVERSVGEHTARSCVARQDHGFRPDVVVAVGLDFTGRGVAHAMPERQDVIVGSNDRDTPAVHPVPGLRLDVQGRQRPATQALALSSSIHQQQPDMGGVVSWPVPEHVYDNTKDPFHHPPRTILSSSGTPSGRPINRLSASDGPGG